MRSLQILNFCCLVAFLGCATQQTTADTSTGQEEANEKTRIPPEPFGGAPPRWKVRAMEERSSIRNVLLTTGVPTERLAGFKLHVLTEWAVAFDTQMPPGCVLFFANAMTGTNSPKNPCMTMVLKRGEDNEWSLQQVANQAKGPGSPWTLGNTAELIDLQ